MSVKTFHDTFDKTWFITFTCYNWIPLFTLIDSYDLVYNWLNLIQKKSIASTLAFVIMPNHVHLLLHLHKEDVNLSIMIGNGKRFMAYEIIKRLQSKGQIEILRQLEESCSNREKIKGQKHKVFEPSFDAKPIYTEKFLHQKLDYIHHNPVKGKWNLASSFVGYPHSSAAFYEEGIKHTLISILDYRDVT